MSILFREFIYPIYHWSKRDGVNAANREQSANQMLTPLELLDLQRGKLERLLDFASRHVPYYRNLFKDTGLSPRQLAELENFGKIPPLTKAAISTNLDGLISEDLSRNGLITNSTSGSTGESLFFYTDQRSTTSRKAVEIRGKEWAGWRSGERIVSLWGSPIDQRARASIRATVHGWITQKKSLSSFDLTPPMMDRYITEILRFKPVIFVSYSGPLEQFAIHCLEKSIVFPSLKGIITSAEKLWPHQRRKIEMAFKVPVFDRYGSRELGNIAQECEHHDGLHVFVDRVLLEIVDENGKACPPGRPGRILVTDLDNYGSPMIRYEIGDNATWSDGESCPCGRGLPKLKQIDGRTMEVVFTPSGNRIGGTFWTFLFKSRPGIRQFQVIQDKIDGIQVRYLVGPEFDLQSLDYFREKIVEKTGASFAVEFVEVDQIELTKSGKRKLIVSHYIDDGGSSAE